MASIDQLRQYLLTLYLQIQREILGNRGETLKMPSGEVDINEWRISKLNMFGKLTDEHYKIISSKAGIAVETVKELLHEAGYKEASKVDASLADAPAVIVGAQESTVLANILFALEQQAINTFNLVNSSVLKGAEQVYLTILNQTTARVLTGLVTPQQALREIAGQWAEYGIPVMRDKIGRKLSLEGYINKVIRSTVKNVSTEMQLGRMDDYDIDLIEVSSHVDARPKCDPYQGRIFSKSGKSTDYPPWSSTSYGDVDGLLGINCRHVIYPFIHGVSVKRFNPYPKTVTDKAYAESQKQRYLERNIRKKKEKLAMMEALNDQEGIKQAKFQVRQAQKRMRDFIDESGRTRRRNREQIEPLSKQVKEQLHKFNNGLGNLNKEIKIPQSTLKHSGVGDFTNPKNPKKDVIGNMRGGGHGQSNIELLNDHGIEYNIIEVLQNGVRLGNIPSHKEKPKKTGKEQSWFPETWTDQDINDAGIYVANLQDKNKYLLEETPFIIRKYANYLGVTVAIVYDKKRHSVTTILPDGAQRLLGGE